MKNKFIPVIISFLFVLLLITGCVNPVCYQTTKNSIYSVCYNATTQFLTKAIDTELTIQNKTYGVINFNLEDMDSSFAHIFLQAKSSKTYVEYVEFESDSDFEDIKFALYPYTESESTSYTSFTNSTLITDDLISCEVENEDEESTDHLYRIYINQSIYGLHFYFADDSEEKSKYSIKINNLVMKDKKGNTVNKKK